MRLAFKVVSCGLFIALGILFPIAFHFFGGLGPVFLPMHIPVIVSGLLLGHNEGFIVGVLTPVLSSLLTGMPPIMPVLPVMTAELAVYGLTAGFLYVKKKLPLYIALPASMFLGRIAAVFVVWGLMQLISIKLKPIYYITGAVVTGMPGIILQFILIPVIVLKLQAIFNTNLINYAEENDAG